VNISRRTYAIIAAPLLGTTLLLAGCSSSSSHDSKTTPTATDGVTTAAGQSCPTAVAPVDTKPQYTFHGSTGSAEVAGSTDSAGPLVKISTPFRVTQTEVHTLTAGTGPIVADHANVTVCYAGYSGTSGKVFDASPYQNGQGSPFGLDQVVPGFTKAIAGQHVGSTVAVAITSADGYGDAGQPGAGIAPGDTLVFEIKILAAQ